MIPPESTRIVHGSTVAIAGRAVLILGRPGAGKSGLALRLIGMGAALVADDQVVLGRRGAALVAAPPPPLAGLIEARGVGLLRLPHLPEAVLTLVADLDFAAAARMPQKQTISYLGVEVELIFGREVPNLDRVLLFIMQNECRVPECF